MVLEGPIFGQENKGETAIYMTILVDLLPLIVVCPGWRPQLFAPFYEGLQNLLMALHALHGVGSTGF